MDRRTNRESAARLAKLNVERLEGMDLGSATRSEIRLWTALLLTNDAILALTSEEYFEENR